MTKKLFSFFLFLSVFCLQAQTTVDCASGVISDSYCYTDDDTNLLTYISSDGSPVRLTIDSGEIEGVPYDVLVVIDSDGVTELYRGEGDNGVLDGLVFESTGDRIFIGVESDGSISCTSGDFPDGLNFTVNCLTTCLSPTAVYTVVNDCDNGDQFLLDVEVTSLGDATSLSLSNNIDANTVTISSLGIYQIGPFPFDTEVVALLQSVQDPNCFNQSDPIEVSVCPPNNNSPCSATIMDGTINSDCTYSISGTMNGSTTTELALPDCAGISYGDVWYQFAATNESHYISVDNWGDGIYRFEFAIYDGSCDSLTELSCADNPLMYVPDLVPGNTYFIRVIYTVNWSETSTFDLCIREAPNNTACDSAVPFCPDTNGVLTTPNVIGIQGLSDIACLAVAPNPTWSIINIDQPGVIEVEISQYNDSFDFDVDFVLWGPFSSLDEGCSLLDFGCPTPDDCLNNTTNPGFYPFGNIVDCSYSPNSVENFTIPNALENEIYLLLVTNFSGFDGEIAITQTNLGANGSGSISADFQVDLGDDITACESQNSVVLEAVVDYADSYEWYVDGFIIQGENESTLEVSESGFYSVIVLNNQCETVTSDSVSVTFVDCNDVGFIEVLAYGDINENGVKDSDEVNFTNGYFTYELNSDGMLNTVSSSTGNFTIISEEDADVYDINFFIYDEYEDCYTNSVGMFSDITVLDGNSITIEFPIINNQMCEDIGINLINNGAPQPGFSHTNYLVITNYGQSTSSGTVDYILDSQLSIQSITSNPNFTTSITASGFTLDFVDLPVGESYTAVITLLTSTNAELGELVTNTATYMSTGNDIVDTNNTSSITEEVIGSYDPNNKMEAHGPQIVFDDFASSDEYLYYTIRFQNLGTAPATFIRIDDIIDSQMDETTFQMLRSSHDYVVTRTENNLEWFFEDINLPAEQDDSEGSNGFVYFRIKPNSGYAIGDIIPNTASIFFDFNAPIVTNTFETEFVEESLSISELDEIVFNVFPNPAKEQITIELGAVNYGILTFNIVDIQGKLIIEQSINQSNTTDIDISDLQSGLYFVKLNAGNEILVKKLIIE
nr:T9SS type A sorting domain-containing protein [uncultured Psychroserpens sp.]